MELRPGRRLFQVFTNDGTLEHGDLLVDKQQRHLAKRRQRAEPCRLIGKINVGAFMREALFDKRNHCALNVRAEMMTDETQYPNPLAHDRLLQMGAEGRTR